MKKQDIEEKVIDLINGNLSKNEKEKLIEELKESGYSIEEIEELKRLYDELDETEAALTILTGKDIKRVSLLT